MKQESSYAQHKKGGIRFAASLEGIMAVLSGMSNLAQMEDSLRFVKNFQLLNADDMRVVDTVRGILKQQFKDWNSDFYDGVNTTGARQGIGLHQVWQARACLPHHLPSAACCTKVVGAFEQSRNTPIRRQTP